MNNQLMALQKFQNAQVNDVFKLALSEPNLRALAKANLSNALVASEKLQKCDPISIASAIVQMTNLGFSSNSGRAYLIPYGTSCTLQISYKGMIELAIRSAKIKILNADVVYDCQFRGKNILTGDYDFDWTQQITSTSKIVGYFCYMELVDGFRKIIFMSQDQLHEHFKQFSKKNYDATNRKWNSDILTVEDKSRITLLKQMLSKWAPQNAEIQSAIKLDGATFEANGNIQTLEYVEETKTIRVPADKELIKKVLIELSKLISAKQLAKNQDEASKLVKSYFKSAGLSFEITNGFYGMTIDEVKQFLIVCEKELNAEITIDGKRYAIEPLESFKDQTVDVD